MTILKLKQVHEMTHPTLQEIRRQQEIVEATTDALLETLEEEAESDCKDTLDIV